MRSWLRAVAMRPSVPWPKAREMVLGPGDLAEDEPCAAMQSQATAKKEIDEGDDLVIAPSINEECKPHGIFTETKPDVNRLEACHRLALSEGQKENEG